MNQYTQQLTVPRIENYGNDYVVTWREGVTVSLVGIEEDRHGDVKAEIEVEDTAELDPFLYGPVRVVLNGPLQNCLKDLGNTSTARTDWKQRLTQVKKLVLPHFRAGEPVKALGTLDAPETQREVLHGVVWEQLPTLIYGPGGIGKSIIALNLMNALHTGHDVAGLKAHQGNALYLDWETSEKQTWWRNREILEAQGQEIGLWDDPDHPGSGRTKMLYYRFMAGPLVNDVKYLQKMVRDLGIRTVCVDSAGPACGGEPENAAATLEFFKALRQIGDSENPLQSIILAHVTHEGRKSGKSSPFGSVYWINIPRNVFELQSSQRDGANHSDFALHHRKSNTGAMREAIGMRLTWHEGCTVEYLDIQKNAELVGGLSMPKQAKIHIDNDGPLSLEELAEKINPTSVRSLSASLSGDSNFISKNGKWDYVEQLGIDDTPIPTKAMSLGKEL